MPAFTHPVLLGTAPCENQALAPWNDPNTKQPLTRAFASSTTPPWPWSLNPVSEYRYQAVLDSYLCLFHVTTGILIDSIFSAFVTAAFFKFIIFSVFELRYLLLIFKARNPRAFQEGWDVMRQALSSFYTRFYASLLIGVVLIYNLRSNPAALILLMYSFWVPQILWSAIQGHRSPMLMTYVFGMSATRLVFPLYLLACPSNFFHSQPMPHIAVLAVLWVGAQALVLFCQRLWGPRFFLPKRFLPASYDYYRVMPSQDGADCAICMAAVGPGGQSGDQDSDRVTTPCDHAFHLGCFKVCFCPLVLPSHALKEFQKSMLRLESTCVFGISGV